MMHLDEDLPFNIFLGSDYLNSQQSIADFWYNK